jgi:hypothetical protein
MLDHCPTCWSSLSGSCLLVRRAAAPRSNAGAVAVNHEADLSPSRTRPARPRRIRAVEPNRTGRTENAGIVRCQSSWMSMTRNSARINPRREAGVGHPSAPERAARGDSSLDQAVRVAPRRDDCQETRPRRRARRAAGSPWPGPPARRKLVGISSPFSIPVAEEAFNESPPATGISLQVRSKTLVPTGQSR